MKQLSIFENAPDNLVEMMEQVTSRIAELPDELRIGALNQLRKMLHEISPFRDEPIDCVFWVKNDTVAPNEYNPNVVYRPEMELLEVSVDEDHFTQPLVTHQNGSIYEIVDGEHRYLVGKNGKIARRLNDYLPITITNTRTVEERMASTIRHNRARGVHKLDSMTDIVLEMIGDGWSDERIAHELGMDADEILRIKQVSGAAAAFSRQSYNRAWINDDGQDEI